MLRAQALRRVGEVLRLSALKVKGLGLFVLLKMNPYTVSRCHTIGESEE